LLAGVLSAVPLPFDEPYHVERSHLSSLRKANISLQSDSELPFIVSRTSWWVSLFFEIPAAAFATQEIPQTLVPIWRAGITSGTGVIPTRSAPMVFGIRMSSRVSSVGPENAM